MGLPGRVRTTLDPTGGAEASRGANHPYRAVVRGQRRSAAGLVLVLVAVAAALVLRTADAAPFSGRPSVPIADDAPTVTFIGDSWTVGRGATDLYGYAPRTADRLGRHARLLAWAAAGTACPVRTGTSSPTASRPRLPPGRRSSSSRAA